MLSLGEDTNALCQLSMLDSPALLAAAQLLLQPSARQLLLHQLGVHASIGGTPRRLGRLVIGRRKVRRRRVRCRRLACRRLACHPQPRGHAGLRVRRGRGALRRRHRLTCGLAGGLGGRRREVAVLLVGGEARELDELLVLAAQLSGEIPCLGAQLCTLLLLAKQLTREPLDDCGRRARRELRVGGGICPGDVCAEVGGGSLGGPVGGGEL